VLHRTINSCAYSADESFPRVKVPVWLPLLLGFLTAVAPLSIDMYLPAFPQIEASYGVAPGTAQITLAAWFAGLAIGQLSQGTLSDRFGRRMPLMIATGVYTLASIGCALAPDLFWLSVFRFIAAVGGSAGMVTPRAIVRDLSDGIAAARMMSKLMLVSGVAPILAPTLGGAILLVAPWHAIFLVCAAYGAICCALVWWKLPDTLPRERRAGLSPATLISRYATIARERIFSTHAAMAGCVSFAMFAYIGGSPQAMIGTFGLSPSEFAGLFGLCAAGFIVASQVNPRILPRFGASHVMRTAVRVLLFTTASLVALSFADVRILPLTIGLIVSSMLCLGFTLQNVTVGALTRHAAHAGSAAALMGTWQFVLGASSVMLVGRLTDATPRGMATLMLLGAIGAAVADLCRPRA
jgi:DHA1 family bicyclomycin/chloramphenicol resistance-like MFS transporter